MIGVLLLLLGIIILPLAFMNMLVFFQDGIGIYGKCLLEAKTHRTLKSITKPHLIIRPAYRTLWEKTNFDDYKVDFCIADRISRNEDKLEFNVNEQGQILHIGKWYKGDLEKYLRPDIKLENVIINR